MDTTTTTNSLLFLDDDDRTQWLTLEQRLRYFEGNNLPLAPNSPPAPSRLQRLLQRLRRR